MTPRKYIRRVESRLASRVGEAADLTYGEVALSANNVATIARPIIGDEPVEVFAALLLDTRHRTLGWVEVSRGTLNSTLVHPREVFGPAVRMGAAAIVVLHNHPSGDPEPSQEDVKLTDRLVKGGELLGIPVLDHVIVSNENHYSLREGGLL